MPRGDRTGPMGYGPRTGRGYGYCSGYDQPGYMHPGPGMGYGGGMGWGRGWGRGFGWGRGLGWGRAHRFWGPDYGPGPRDVAWGAPMAEPTPEVEVNDLKAQASWLQEQLDAIQARMDELKGKTDDA